MSRTIRDDHYRNKPKRDFCIGGTRYPSEPDLKSARDKKKWYKPGKDFKKPRRSSEKAKVKQAIKHEKEIMPIFKKDDVWNWT